MDENTKKAAQIFANLDRDKQEFALEFLINLGGFTANEHLRDDDVGEHGEDLVALRLLDKIIKNETP